MPYEENNTKSSFYAFMRAAGVSAKTGRSSGGSFGFGKGAYFALSAIKTVLASTKTKDNKYFFEGTTRLTTHLDKNGKKKTAFGYYNDGQSKPVSNPKNIPLEFLRKEPGTDFIIVGRQEETLEKMPMIKSVLNNFWLAILNNKLSVTVNGETLNKNSLDTKITEYFGDEETDNASVNDFENWNPKSYYKAVHYANKNEKFKKFTKNLTSLGKVEYYVYRSDGLSNKSCFLRKPNMVVYKETNNKLNGYSGVFKCDDPKGDEILMEMENPAHNEWNSSNYLTLDDKRHPDGVKAKGQIYSFINDCLEELAAEDIGSTTTVLGLDEYINIPEDLIGDEELVGDSLNENFGQETDELSESETGSLTNVKTDHRIKSIKNNPVREVKKNEKTELNDDGQFDTTVGVDEEGKSKTGEPHPNAGDQLAKGNKGENPSTRMINISYRVIAQGSTGEISHILLINSSNIYSGIQLDLVVGSDQGDSRKDDNARVIYSDNGRAENSSIKEVELKKGLNKITVKFDDNFKHSIGVKAYEIR